MSQATLSLGNRFPSELLRQALWQIPALSALAGLLAVGVNHWCAGGIPLINGWTVWKQAGLPTRVGG